MPTTIRAGVASQLELDSGFHGRRAWAYARACGAALLWQAFITGALLSCVGCYVPERVMLRALTFAALMLISLPVGSAIISTASWSCMRLSQLLPSTTSLYNAVAVDDMEFVKALLLDGADIEQGKQAHIVLTAGEPGSSFFFRVSFGRLVFHETPLCLAASGGNIALVNMLLEAGAAPDAGRDSGPWGVLTSGTPLFFACQK